MDDATVLHACRLLHDALFDDLELRQLTVNIERDRVSLTIHSKRGRQESKVVVGENSATENARARRLAYIGPPWEEPKAVSAH
jgi:hypothetical protein